LLYQICSCDTILINNACQLSLFLNIRDSPHSNNVSKIKSDRLFDPVNGK